MKAIAHCYHGTISPECEIQHNGVSIMFSISVFGKKSFPDDYDVFAYLNKYWSELPQQDQDRIFDIYGAIYDTLNCMSLSAEMKADKVSDYVKDLFEYHHVDMFRDWVSFNGINIPDSFPKDYVGNIDENRTKEKTYTQRDYVYLVALSLSLQCMTPIWGEHIFHTRSEIGTDFKEFYSFRLLSKTEINHCPPMIKLKQYIENIVGDDANNATHTLNDICPEDFCYWLTTLVCIKRLCVGDIRGLDSRSNLMTVIFKFIMQRISTDSGDFRNAVKEKLTDDRGTEENKTSILERYKITSDVSIGDLCELSNSLRDIVTKVNVLSSNIVPESLFATIDHSFDVLTKHRQQHAQFMLCCWTFKPIISPRGLEHEDVASMAIVQAATEEVLWARGHKYLAILASSFALPAANELMVTHMDRRTKIDKSNLENLIKYYPFKKNPNTRKANTEVKDSYLIVETIDNLVDCLSMYVWVPTARQERVEEVFGANIRRVPIDPNIRNSIATLCIELGARNWS